MYTNRLCVCVCFLFFLMIRRPPRSTRFPYTSHFRSLPKTQMTEQRFSVYAERPALVFSPQYTSPFSPAPGGLAGGGRGLTPQTVPVSLECVQLWKFPLLRATPSFRSAAQFPTAFRRNCSARCQVIHVEFGKIGGSRAERLCANQQSLYLREFFMGVGENSPL